MSILADPADIADYADDFAALLATSETLSTIVSVTAPTGLTVLGAGKAPAISGTRVVFWLSGGVVGTSYDVETIVTTSGGRTFADTVRVLVQTRS